ncbi:MAG: S1C family serine protease [Candidatus Moranbacteria bacterium]|nr:S1C family serine protease [Candidatus Moranbacteria bacterium]
MFKKFLKTGVKIIIVLLLFGILAGFFGVLAERFVMPWLSTKDNLQKFKFFQKANEKVTVINKTEQITVKEDFSVSKSAQGILPAVVSIIDYAGSGQASDGLLPIRTSLDLSDRIRTGMIITSDGLIMSMAKESEIDNKNLVIGQKVKILASDGREFDAAVTTIDPFSSLVFYKAEASLNLPSPGFGDSGQLENGEKIIIVGNAGGQYQNAFSLGIIKEKDKTFTLLNSELSSSEKMEGAILTDAEINSQNIGGPVVDFNGQVVGLAGQIEKDGKKVGYIMPISNIKPIVDRVIRGEKIERPYFGAYYLSINREIALLNNLPVSQGALVYSFSSQQGLAIIKSSPADQAGILIGDIITEINGDQVNLDNPLSNLLMKSAKGEEITLKLLRGGKEIQVKLKLN